MGDPLHLAGRLSAGSEQSVVVVTAHVCVAGGYRGHLVAGPGFLSVVPGMLTVFPWMVGGHCAGHLQMSSERGDLAAGHLCDFGLFPLSPTCHPMPPRLALSTCLFPGKSSQEGC